MLFVLLVVGIKIYSVEKIRSSLNSRTLFFVVMRTIAFHLFWLINVVMKLSCIWTFKLYAKTKVLAGSCRFSPTDMVVNQFVVTSSVMFGKKLVFVFFFFFLKTIVKVFSTSDLGNTHYVHFYRYRICISLIAGLEQLYGGWVLTTWWK